MLYRLLAAALLLGALAFPPARAQADDWQQAVAYDMEITLLADRHRLQGRQTLAYTNNSPDTLAEVYYHLYFNAFHPQSMMAERNRQLPDPDRRVVPRIFELGPDEQGWHRIGSLKQDGVPVEWEVNDTVMRVALARPIGPGETSVFEMTFTSQVPLQTRRSGRDNREGIDYSMTQWYPKMAQYDGTGWHADPYIGREFYAPFGSFDIAITAPADYVIGATGTLQNPDAVGHGYAAGPTGEPVAPGPAPGPEGTAPDSLTWRWSAERVHDFAWVADPDYLHEWHRLQGVYPSEPDRTVDVHFLYQPDVAEGWAPLDDWMALLFLHNNAAYGDYVWPQFSVWQGGDGGMEYPMATLITGRRPPASLLGVTQHEFAHMWFYGVLATNETDFAWMDEGFTSFATGEGIAFVNQLMPFMQAEDETERTALEAFAAALESGAVLERPSHAGDVVSFVALDRQGIREPIDTPSDWFHTNRAYGTASYSGGEALLDLLGYTIGDAARDEGLRLYYDRFAFRHPQPEDVQKVFEDVSGQRLDWLFQQWLDETDAMDYRIAGFDAVPQAGGFRTTIRLERTAPFVMPADLLVETEGGGATWVHVPLTVQQGHKPLPEGWILAEAWPWTSPEHTVTVTLPARPTRVTLDPLGRTPDRDLLDNRAGGGVPVDLGLSLRAPRASRDQIGATVAPLGAFSDEWGFGGGARLSAAWPFGDARLRAALMVWPAVVFDEDVGRAELFSGTLPALETSFLDGFDYDVDYERRLPALGAFGRVHFSAAKHLGIVETRLGVSRPLQARPAFSSVRHTLAVEIGHEARTSDRASRALNGEREFVPVLTPYTELTGFEGGPLFWASLKYALETEGAYVRASAETGAGRHPMAAPSGPRERRYSANRVALEAGGSFSISGPFRLAGHLAAGYGSDDLALQRQFRLGAATPLTAWRSDTARPLLDALPGSVDGLVFAFANAGPVAYLTEDRSPGTRLVAATIALEASPLEHRPRSVLAPLSVELFGSVGEVWGQGRTFSTGDLLFDAGLGARYDVSALRILAPYTAASPFLSGLTITAKFPFVVSDPRITGAQGVFDFRAAIGVTTGL